MQSKTVPHTWEIALVKKATTNISIEAKIPTKSYLEQGKFPVIDQGKNFISGYANISRGLIANIPVIIFGDHTRVLKYVDFPFLAGADGIKVLKAKKFILPKLLFYFLQAIALPDRGYARHFQYLEQSVIPVPPMAEQKRIVRKIEELFGVIDRDIQRLTDTLEQLSQFRQSVLEKLLNNPVYPQISFNDGIEKIIGGSTPSKTVSAYYEGHIPFMTVKDMTSPRPQDTAWHITQEAVDNCSTHIIPANTLITATRVGLGKTVLMPFPVAINQDLKALVLNKNKVNTRFFEFILNAKTTEIISKSRGTTVKGITLEDFKSIKFYIPTLPEQQKIVDEIEKAFRSADKVQKAVQNALEEAKKLKQSILKKAFAGELVPQDPNDKPVDLTQLKKDKHK